MEYVYAALLLHKLQKEINEENVSSLVKASGTEVNPSQVKALVAALSDVNIDEAHQHHKLKQQQVQKKRKTKRRKKRKAENQKKRPWKVYPHYLAKRFIFYHSKLLYSIISKI